MQSTRHIVEWHGERYTVVPLNGSPGATPPPVEAWAVSRGGKFIGMISCEPHETDDEFASRCARWVADLVGL